VIEFGRCPSCRVVAVPTRNSQAAFVGIFCSMTRVAISGCSLQDMFDMAFFARYPGMLAFQFEGGQVMVKGGR
jgi:hypothetical protein